MHASVTDRTRWPWRWMTVLVLVCVARWWWPSSDEAQVPAPSFPAAPPPAAALVPTPLPVAAKPVDVAPPVPAFRLVGTVMGADGAYSFALVRRTADAQLMQLRTGDQVEGWTVGAIGADSVALAGSAGRASLIRADRTVAAPLPPRPSRLARPEAEPEPAWADDPAPFGH